MKKVAISQSNYIPWRGYFDLIASVDEFVIYDEMQYTKRDWRNRNKIKIENDSLLLTVPVKVKGKFIQKICDTEISGTSWKKKHWQSIKLNYSKAPFFKDIEKELENIYCKEDYYYLSQLNRRFIDLICQYLNIKTNIRDSCEFDLKENKTERLINICKDLDADEYISGPAAKEYINPQDFEKNNIKLTYIDYSIYQNYKQLKGKFIDNLSTLDLIFNCGKSSVDYMQYA